MSSNGSRIGSFPLFSEDKPEELSMMKGLIKLGVLLTHQLLVCLHGISSSGDNE